MTTKKILITNDDGINSDGLIRLAKSAKKFGEVWVVAPDSQRSAMSHSITLRDSIDVFPVDFPVDGVHGYKCTGTPSDCVRIGVLNIVPEKPDVLLSGINYGYNSASDIQYSATVGAAFEGAFQGIHSIALSEGASECHDVTDFYLDNILSELINETLESNMIWNVNFPDCKIDNCNGILRNRIVSSGGFYIDRYLVENLDCNGLRLKVNGIYNENADDKSDFKAIVDNYISISKLRNIL